MTYGQRAPCWRCGLTTVCIEQGCIERVVNRTAYRSAFIQRVPYSVKSDIQIGEIESGVVRLPSLYGSFYSDPSYAIRERPYGGVDCTVSWAS